MFALQKKKKNNCIYKQIRTHQLYNYKIDVIIKNNNNNYFKVM